MFISQADAQNIVDEMKTTINRDINIMDEMGCIVASTNPSRQGQIHHGAARILRDSLPSLTIWEDAPDLGVQMGINLPINIEGRTVGVIGITGAPAEVSAFGNVIKRLTEIMVESIQQREQEALIDHAKSLFVENWLFSEHPDWAELEVRGRLLGFFIMQPYTVAVLQLPDTAREEPTKIENLNEMRNTLILHLVQNHLQQEKKSYCTVIRDKIIILLCSGDRGAVFSKIRRIGQDVESYYATRISGGISSSSKGPVDIRRCYLEAQTASAVAAQDPASKIMFYDEVSLEFIIQSIPRKIKRDLQVLVFSDCTLEERDELEQIIRLYFNQDGDIKRCADAMFIHRNTFQYRLDRLKKRTGYDIRVPKDAILLYLAAQGDHLKF